MISVIIPVHNVELFLRRCLDSVLNSTYKDFEIILIENGSTDNSPTICREYAERYANIRLIVSEIKGVSHARNLGLDAARGEWVTFVDSDDYISPYMLEILHTEAQNHQADLVHARRLLGSEDEHVFEKPTYKTIPESTADYFYRLFVKDDRQGISVSYKLYSTGLARKVRFDEALAFGEDMCYICMLVAQAQHILKVNAPVYYYYSRPNSICHDMTDLQKVRAFRMQTVYALCKDLAYIRTVVSETEADEYAEYIYAHLLPYADHRLKQARKYHMPDQIKELKPIRKEAVKHVWKAKHLKSEDRRRILCWHYIPHLTLLLCRIRKALRG